MRNLWFHLMPYKDLPDDFRERHPSVWVDIDAGLLDAGRVHQHYNEYLDELEYAAEVGFDGVCCNEHHQNGYGLMPSPNLIAAALTRRTSSPAICVMGNSLALYNPPTRVAEEFAMLDCMSGGRLIAGFPVGTPMDTVFAYGRNPSQLRERYYEAHDLVMQAWQREETFSFHGRFNQLRYVNVWPRPVQTPHPPVWIPGGGSVETWRWCAERDYVYSYLSYFGYKAGAATMRGFWDEMDRLGKDRNPYRAGFLQFVAVGETEKEALELYREPAEYFYGRCLHVNPKWASPAGYQSEATMRAKVQSQVALAAARSGAGAAGGGSSGTKKDAMGAAREWRDILDLGYVIAGDPDQVAERIREVCVSLNVGHLMLLCQFGNMTTDLAQYNTRLYAEKVLPQIADLFDDEWQDRWWPQPLAERATPRQAARNQQAA